MLAQALLLGLSIAAPVDGVYAVKETFVVPPSFERVGDAPENHRIRLSVGLKQSQFEELERHLYESMLLRATRKTRVLILGSIRS